LIGGHIDDQYMEYEYDKFFATLVKKLNDNEELQEHSRCFLDVSVAKIWDCDLNRTFQEIEILNENEKSIFEDDAETNSIERVRIEFLLGLEVLNSNHIYIYNFKNIK
jgi:hypothetical protein